MFLHTLLHHRTEEIGDAAEPQGRCFIPRDVRRFLDVEGDFNLLAAFGRVETPLIFVQPVAVIYIGTSAAATADVGIFTIAAFALELRVTEGIEDVRLFPEIRRSCVREYCRLTAACRGKASAPRSA